MTSNDELAAIVFDLQKQVKALGGTAQLTSSTVGETDEEQVDVSEAVADAAVTNDAVPDLQDDVADSDESTSDLTAILQATSDDLDARFEDRDIDLANAREELEEAQQQIRDAFGQELQGISERVDQIVVGAGGTLLLYSEVAPTPDDKAPTGSTWWMINADENIVGQWQQTGTDDVPVWTPRAIRSDIIANLDVGKLTAGQAAIAELVAIKIAASTASIQTVNVENLFVTAGATMKQAVIDYLFANVVTAKKITVDMLDVNSLNGITLTGVRIAGGSITTTPSTNDQTRGIVRLATSSINWENYAADGYRRTAAMNLDTDGALYATGQSGDGTANDGWAVNFGGKTTFVAAEPSTDFDAGVMTAYKMYASRVEFGGSLLPGRVMTVDSVGGVDATAYRLGGKSIIPDYGSVTVDTDSNGVQTISHDLGVVPSYVFLQVWAPRMLYEITVRVVLKTATTITVAWHYNSTAWANQNLTDRGLYFQAIA